MNFPQNCVRGIPNDSYMNKDGAVAAHLFHFDKLSSSIPDKNELSINWEDEDSVVEFTLSQTRDDGTLQFKFGVTILPREAIDRLSSQPTIRGLLSYERREINGNRYHGNILLDAGTEKKTMKQIAGALALHCRPIPREGKIPA